MDTLPIMEMEPTNPIAVLRQADDPILSETMLGQIVGVTTESHAEQAGSGAATQDLAELHRAVRGHCSDQFRFLRDSNPTFYKEQINADPQLLALNSVRRTLHQAMVRRQKQASRPRRQATWIA